MEGKSFARNTEIERFFSHFRQLITSDLTLVSGSEFENFLSVERDGNTEISQKVPNLGFFFKKRCIFCQNLYDFCQCRNFFHIMDCSQTDFQNFSRENLWNCQIYVENLHCQRILTVGLLSVYLVNKIQFRLKLYFELSDLESFRFSSQILHLTVKSNLGSLLGFTCH